MLFQCRSQIFHIKAHGAFGSPGTTGIRSVAVCLVLIHDHINGNSLFFVGINEFAEIVGIRLQIAGVLYHIVVYSQLFGEHVFTFFSIVLVKGYVRFRGHFIGLVATHRVVMVDFHPTGRRPGRNPECHPGIVLLCRTDERYDCQLITVNVEILQLEVARYFVAAIPVAGIIVRIHRNSSSCEA